MREAKKPSKAQEDAIQLHLEVEGKVTCLTWLAFYLQQSRDSLANST